MFHVWRVAIAFVHRSPLRALVAALIVVPAALAVAWWLRDEYFLRKGKRALERHDFAAAREHFESCMKVRPSGTSVQLLAAHAARRAGDLDAAQHYLSELQKFSGSNDDNAFEWALLQAQRGDPKSLQSYSRGQPERDPARAALILEASADGALHKANYPFALETLDRLLSRQPDHFQGRLLRAQVWVELSRWEEARTDLVRAVELRPDSAEAQRRLGNVDYHLGMIVDAAQHFSLALELRPDDVDAKFGLSRCYADSKSLGRAASLLGEILAQQPRHAAALVELGRIELRLGNGDKAIEALERAANAAPNNREAWTLLRRALEAQGRVDDARRAESRCRQLESQARRGSPAN